MASARAKAASFAVVAALLVWVGALVAPTLASAPHLPASDDGYYAKYMREVGERGVSALPEQFRWYLSDRQHWVFPPPSRLGFSLASALWSKLFEPTTDVETELDHLSQLSLAAHLALITLQFLFARRHLGELRAVLVAALTAFAPLCLGLSRLALTDSFISLCQVPCLWLFLEVVGNPRSWPWRIAFVLTFTFAIVTKEIAVLLVLPFAAWVAIERFHRGRALSLALFASLLAVPPLLAVLVWIAAAGGPGALVDTLKIVLLSPATNEYARDYGSGGWYRYPIDEILTSVWPTLLGLAGVALAFWRWRRGEYDLLRVGFALVYVLQIGVLSFFTKNLRYIALLEAPLRVLAVLVVWDFVASTRTAWSRVAACALVAALCWADWNHFQTIFIAHKVYDPMTFGLSVARELIVLSPEPGK